MKREWQIGDIAFGRINSYEGAFVYRGDFDGWDELTGTEGGWDGDYIKDLRSMVVIDPESVVLDGQAESDDDRIPEIVSCLRQIAESDWRTWRSTLCRRLADEFERQNKPSKPEEPTGLGAVVEDSTGQLWVRQEKVALADMHWHRVGALSSAKWVGIDAVKVLSEGVTP